MRCLLPLLCLAAFATACSEPAEPVTPTPPMKAAPEPPAELPADATFSVVLTGTGPRKIDAIKALREVTGLGLKDSKALADGAPSVVASGLTKTAAAEMTQRLLRSGASVRIRLE